MNNLILFEGLLERREKLTKNWMGKTINKRDKRERRLMGGKGERRDDFGSSGRGLERWYKFI